ncbi:hypothetical protein CDEST_10091 [Colletotrichum destructivum]|uniref:Uncharacterized protein n=1 Tax=Colletotrichum destructivum TaxID=34406 RepID=A0AAX4INX3_9PEZI|nr:hypothetical protein CDEST_10091 [Colletotrichum destructivum]
MGKEKKSEDRRTEAKPKTTERVHADLEATVEEEKQQRPDNYYYLLPDPMHQKSTCTWTPRRTARQDYIEEKRTPGFHRRQLQPRRWVRIARPGRREGT